MILDNLKERSLVILRVFLGIVFISAAIFRIINFSSGMAEMQALGLPGLSSIIIILLEIASGLLLILNKYIRIAVSVLVVVLTIGVIVALVTNFHNIMINFKELFVLDATPTDIVYHIALIVGLVQLFFFCNEKKK